MISPKSKLLISLLTASCLVVVFSTFADSLPSRYQGHRAQRLEIVSLESKAPNSSAFLSEDGVSVQALIYKGCLVQVSLEFPYLQVEHQPLTISQDSDTGSYFSPDVPYERFTSPEELGKAFVNRQGMDCRS